MAGFKRFLATAGVIAAVATATLGLAAPVSAAPYVTAPTLSVVTTTPCSATPFTVTGANFVPGSTVTLTLTNSQTFTLGSATVGANGAFTATVTLPAAFGTFQLVASGPPTATNTNRATATLNILNCAVPTVPVTG